MGLIPRMPSDESSRRGKGSVWYLDGGQPHQAHWMHGRGDKSIGRHQANGIRKNSQRIVRGDGTHIEDPTHPDSGFVYST